MGEYVNENNSNSNPKPSVLKLKSF